MKRYYFLTMAYLLWATEVHASQCIPRIGLLLTQLLYSRTSHAPSEPLFRIGRIDRGEEFSRNIEYLYGSAREYFRIEWRGNLIYQNGKPLDTQSSPDGVMLFIVEPRTHTIYSAEPLIAREQHPELFERLEWPKEDDIEIDLLELKHSSFLAGQPVAMAGLWAVHNGRLVEWTRDSGHYRPTRRGSVFFRYLLQTRGLDGAALELPYGQNYRP